MASLFTVIVFFFILILLYSAAAWGLWVRKWLLRCLMRENHTRGVRIENRLDRQTDRLKDLAFTTTIILSFFLMAPLAVLLWLL